MNPSPLRLALVLALALVASTAGLARAQDDAVVAHDDEAHALFEAGVAALAAGRFDEAYDRFQRAHELSGRPEMLYNVGAAADRAGRDADALVAYEAFLASLPHAENLAFVQARIAVLRERIGAGDDADVGAEQDPDDAPAHRAADHGAAEPDPTAMIAGATLLGLAGATGIAAIITGSIGLALRSDLEARCPMHACSGPDDAASADQMSALGLATDVLAGTTLALAVVGLVLVLIDPGGAREGARLDRRGVSLRAVF
ncbi:MAG: hypothetical protein AB7S26_16400 [Sandaracinaceae bacterium]